MKSFLTQLLTNVENQILGRCLVREYVQARLLQSFQDKGVFSKWLFQGGTAFRFLYSMPRFSEYLDFALVKPEVEDNFRDNLLNAKKTFEDENYDVDVKVKDKKTVKSAFIRFRGLLFELGLSGHESETLSVKIEIDTNPPAGANFTSTVIRRHVTLNLRHYDKPSLLAGKLHAVLARRYVKGRDIYDLVWYLSDRSWPEPNVEFLNNVLKQTDWEGPVINSNNWRNLLQEKIQTLRWDRVQEDVQPFLERSEDINLLTKQNLFQLLQ